jgi:hypothetical protein
VDNINMDLREIGWDGMDWIDVAQDADQRRALVNMVFPFIETPTVAQVFKNFSAFY